MKSLKSCHQPGSPNRVTTPASDIRMMLISRGMVGLDGGIIFVRNRLFPNELRLAFFREGRDAFPEIIGRAGD